jgi:hypothetical protein
MMRRTPRGRLPLCLLQILATARKGLGLQHHQVASRLGANEGGQIAGGKAPTTCLVIGRPDRAVTGCARMCSKPSSFSADFSCCAAQKCVEPVRSLASLLLRKGISPFRRVTGVSSLNSAALSGAAFLLRRLGSSDELAFS